MKVKFIFILKEKLSPAIILFPNKEICIFAEKSNVTEFQGRILAGSPRILGTFGRKTAE